MCQLAHPYFISHAHKFMLQKPFQILIFDFCENAIECRERKWINSYMLNEQIMTNASQLSKKQSRNAMKINLTSLTFWPNTNIKIKGTTTTADIVRWVDKVTVFVRMYMYIYSCMCVCEANQANIWLLNKYYMCIHYNM